MTHRANTKDKNEEVEESKRDGPNKIIVFPTEHEGSENSDSLL